MTGDRERVDEPSSLCEENKKNPNLSTKCLSVLAGGVWLPYMTALAGGYHRKKVIIVQGTPVLKW